MIQTQPPIPPRSEFELQQFLRQVSRDLGTLYREYKQHTDLLLVLQIQAYAELEQIQARKRDTFNWAPQPQVRVSPVSMPVQPQIHHLHAGQQQGNSGRMRFAEEAEAPTLPDPSPWGKER